MPFSRPQLYDGNPSQSNETPSRSGIKIYLGLQRDVFSGHKNEPVSPFVTGLGIFTAFSGSPSLDNYARLSFSPAYKLSEGFK